MSIPRWDINVATCKCDGAHTEVTPFLRLQPVFFTSKVQNIGVCDDHSLISMLYSQRSFRLLTWFRCAGKELITHRRSLGCLVRVQRSLKPHDASTLNHTGPLSAMLHPSTPHINQPFQPPPHPRPADSDPLSSGLHVPHTLGEAIDATLRVSLGSTNKKVSTTTTRAGGSNSFDSSSSGSTSGARTADSTIDGIKTVLGRFSKEGFAYVGHAKLIDAAPIQGAPSGFVSRLT